MLLTFPNVFNAKQLRKDVLNEKDLEAHLRHKVYVAITSNRTTRTTEIHFTKNYTKSNINTITSELNERGFAVTNLIDLSGDKERKGLKITY